MREAVLGGMQICGRINVSHALRCALSFLSVALETQRKTRLSLAPKRSQVKLVGV